MSETDELDAILRHLRRELGDAEPAHRVEPTVAEGGVDACLREIRSACGSTTDARRYLGELFAPVLIGMAVCAGVLLFA